MRECGRGGGSKGGGREPASRKSSGALGGHGDCPVCSIHSPGGQWEANGGWVSLVPGRPGMTGSRSWASQYVTGHHERPENWWRLEEGGGGGESSGAKGRREQEGEGTLGSSHTGESGPRGPVWRLEMLEGLPERD